MRNPMESKVWMVRGDAGRLYDNFREENVVAIGWSQLAPYVKPGLSRDQLLAIYLEHEPQVKLGTARSGRSQIWRFVNEIKQGDWVITYSPANRTYLSGRVISDFEYHPEWLEKGMGIARRVKWNAEEIKRDNLSDATKNPLGSTLTVFQLPEYAVNELLYGERAGAVIIPPPPEMTDDEEAVSDPLRDMEMVAFEGIKDRINRLDWDEMQHLIAGVLRSMGYKTQVSPAGADRGKDIIASPDGFGFENPRIIVEVKHRRDQTGSQQIRSFIGGRHKDDRGLYVSTGGFTKDARYEADRSTIPLTLWTLDDLVRALLENYEQIDIETKLLVPLKRTYLPA
ncbi:restriction endonuclease [Erwinia pyrifoliae]|uniref:restriction endonuclease n=1 Tax=Erwinia pyrifoliae TaxID=79967 RepID=UPI00223B3C39|nr:restriction endonuclease [Erwinia pyrifoliae]MCT2388057.1 restriction endonuclease [Erwinia pyrifoliae]MCU8586227.1 restriction endonuclease [Erwinia pyrifoliae]